MIKGAHVLETLPQIDCIAFDKTGTLTSGEFSIESIKVFDQQHTEAQCLAIAAALEAHSEHPIAKAFVKYRACEVQTANTKIKSGFGISGTIGEEHYAIGKAAWLLSGEQLQQSQAAQCVLVRNQQLVAAFYLNDNVRQQAFKLLNNLKKANIKTLLVSGDNAIGCQKVADSIALDEIYHSLTAEDKMTIIQNLQQMHRVAVVGDGVNDTPVFGAAHVSIAMGSGTDVAKSGADIILLNNQLSSIEEMQYTAKKTGRIIKENYAWAIGYNAIVLPLAVTGNITPYLAVIGMSLSSILVITNSLRLLKK